MIKRGDYFLLPFRGERIDLLVRAVREIFPGTGQWETKSIRTGTSSVTFLSSCHRCPDSLAKRIINAARKEVKG